MADGSNSTAPELADRCKCRDEKSVDDGHRGTEGRPTVKDLYLSFAVDVFLVHMTSLGRSR